VTTRDEHVAWCKVRALEYLDADQVNEAFSSLVSDLSKHDGTRYHTAIELGAMQLFAGQLRTPEAMRDFIEGVR
jgi:hypothetical protein